MAWILYSEGSFVVIKVSKFADFCVARTSVNLRIACTDSKMSQWLNLIQSILAFSCACMLYLTLHKLDWLINGNINGNKCSASTPLYVTENMSLRFFACSHKIIKMVDLYFAKWSFKLLRLLICLKPIRSFTIECLRSNVERYSL